MYTQAQLNNLNVSLPRRGDITIIYFMAAVTVYLSLLVVHYFDKSEVTKLVSNGVAFSIFACLVPRLFSSSGRLVLHKHYVLALGLLIFGMLFSGVVNIGQTEFADYLKMTIGPLFFVIGYRSSHINEFRGTARRQMLFLTTVIFALPVMIAVGEAAGWGAQFQDGQSVSIFSNRNNAALYAIVLSILFMILNMRLRWLVVYLLAVAVLFGTLGVLLAVILSIALVHLAKGRFIYLVTFSSLLLVSMIFMPDLPVIDRLSSLHAGLSHLFSSGEIWRVSDMSYGELSQVMGGSSDVSFFFRIKHWSELIGMYLNGSLEQIFFGHGVGSSVRDTSLSLVPHNDYLRYLYECGLLAFIGFLFLNLRIVKDMGSSYIAVPFLTVTLYFFSENLINNFLAMMLYFFLAGFLIARKKAIAKLKVKHEYFAG